MYHIQDTPSLHEDRFAEIFLLCQNGLITNSEIAFRF